MTSGSQAVELGELKQAMQRMTPQWVSTHELSKVLEFESGRSRDVKDVIGSDYARVMLMWTAIKQAQQQGGALATCDSHFLVRPGTRLIVSFPP